MAGPGPSATGPSTDGVDERAPVGVDRTARLPDWIIIGAMKCATTSLHRYLEKHPAIATSEPKELNFFVEPRYSELGIEWYERQFLDPPDAVSAGESSVNYTKCHELPGVAERIHRHVPDVKLIYVLRDPLKRIESHWVHEVGEGLWRGDFASALRDLDTSRPVQTSRYWTQLEEYLQFFDPSQIKIVSYETLSSDPRSVVSEILDFIDLDPDFEHPVIGNRIHDSRRKLRPSRLGLLLWDDKVRRRRYRKYFRLLGLASPIKRPTWTPADRERVRAYLAPEVDAIRDFSGLDFTEWSM